MTTSVGTRVVVLGLRATGDAVARLLHAEGARVTVGDDAPGAPGYAERVASLRALGVVVEDAGVDWATLVAGAQLVVPSPGVRPSHPAIVAAARTGIAIRSEVDLAAERITSPLVAVTGTNGKTTVTELITDMLRRSGCAVECAGNIGSPLVTLVGVDAEVVVAEVSSFQLAFTTEHFRPRVAVLLNIADDHLDWHGSFAAYADAKAMLFANQRDDDMLIVNAADGNARNLARRSSARVTPVLAPTAPVAELVLADGRPLVRVDDLPRSLPHDQINSLVAAEGAIAAGASLPDVRETLRTYTTRPHRVQLVAEAAGIRWYDDSKATNPHAALQSIVAFDSVVLLAGGLNKGLDLEVLAEVAGHVRAVVAFGDAAGDVESAFTGVRPVEVATSMEEVVDRAARLAAAGDVVLLAPACASFDWYAGYDERGDDFSRCVIAHIAEATV